MEEREYIVFKVERPQPAAEDFSFGPSIAAALPPTGAVATSKLTPEDAAITAREPDTVLAEPLPTKLIRPVAARPAEAAEASGTAWGVEAVGAVASTFDGQGATVAVLDTGIDASHPAFAGIEVVEQDFTGEGNGDDDGHGTHCAGTIAGRDVDGLRLGVARGVEKLLIGKVLGAGGGSTTAITSAMMWALDNGADVISMSLGIDFPGVVARLTAGGVPVQAATSRALEGYRANIDLFRSVAQVIEDRAKFGSSALVVAATGNESERGGMPAYTIAVSPPAASRGVIAVAALGRAAGGGLAVAQFSNTGAALAGPGVDIVSAAAGGGLASMSGTSMATPHVAGVAALWVQKLKQDGQLTPLTLASRLVGSSQTLQDLTAIDGGAGLVQAPS